MAVAERSIRAERIVGAELIDIYEKVVAEVRLTFSDAVRLYLLGVLLALAFMLCTILAILLSMILWLHVIWFSVLLSM